MTITTTSQVLHDGERNVVMQFTGRSDGTGQEDEVVKVDVSELTPPCASVKIEKLTYDVKGGQVRLSWSAVPNEEFMILGGNGEYDYGFLGGLVNKTPDADGDMLLSTAGFELDSSYALTLEMIKKF